MRPISFADLGGIRSSPFLSRLSPRYRSYPVYLEELLRQLPYTARRITTRHDLVDPALIVGTVGPRPDYDADLIPRDDALRAAWEAAREAAVPGGVQDEIDLVEVGGQYFVRSGLEIASVAKLHLLGHVPARVERYACPVQLPRHMDRRRLPVFRAKLEFHLETGAFDHIPEDSFDAAKASTWRILADSVLDRRSGAGVRERIPGPPPRESVSRWYESVYSTVVRYVAESCLALELEDCHDTDIFAQVIRRWRHAPPYTSLSDSFSQYAERVRERSAVAKQIRRLVPGETGRARFLRVSRLTRYVPNAVLPMGGDRWYHYLTEQLRILESQTLRRRLGRQPNMRELVTTWYEEILRPVYGVYRQEPRRHRFPHLYIRWLESEAELNEALASRRNGTHVRVRESFARYIDSQ